jgi:hypothetical protein
MTVYLRLVDRIGYGGFFFKVNPHPSVPQPGSYIVPTRMHTNEYIYMHIIKDILLYTGVYIQIFIYTHVSIYPHPSVPQPGSYIVPKRMHMNEYIYRHIIKHI